MRISRSIHVPANGIISFCLWLNNIPLYIHTTSSWVLLSSVLFRIFCVFSHSVVSDLLWPHGLQHAKLPCSSQSPRVCSDSCPLNWRCHSALPCFFIVIFLVDYKHIFKEQFVVLWPPHAKSWLIGKDSDAGRDWGQEEKGTTGWDGWMASQTRRTWVWVNSGRWRWTGRPGVLRFMGSQRVGHDWATELNWRFWSH